MKSNIRFLAVVISSWVWVSGSRARAEEAPESEWIGKVRIAIQEKFAKLPEVKANVGEGGVKFTTMDLRDSLTEVDGEHYYAFRFQAPAEGGDLVWSFKSTPVLSHFYIFAENERMQGFTGFQSRYLPEDTENVGSKGDRFIIQKLVHRNMKPGGGYIMWFKAGEGGEPKLTFSLNFTTKDSVSVFKKFFPMLYPELTSPPEEPREELRSTSKPADQSQD